MAKQSRTVPETLRTFMQMTQGRRQAGNTLTNRGQCVGLVALWIEALGFPHLWGDAKDLLANADHRNYKIIHNTPTNYPHPGDIVVWDDTWGDGYGHTGIAFTGAVMSMAVYTQNDPTGSTPHLKVYGYQGVLGWLHPLVKL